MSKQQTDTQPATGSVQEVDRIRDIIFGTQMRDYEQRFQLMQRDVERLQGEIERLNGALSTQDGEQGKKLQGLRQELRQADNDLRDEVRDSARRLTNDKVDRIGLADMFIELGNQLKNGGSIADILTGLDKPE